MDEQIKNGDTCSKCSGHGGIYEVMDNGEIIGFPCDECDPYALWTYV